MSTKVLKSLRCFSKDFFFFKIFRNYVVEVFCTDFVSVSTRIAGRALETAEQEILSLKNFESGKAQKLFFFIQFSSTKILS